MFKRTQVCAAVLVALGAIPAVAQDAGQRIEITGSAIKRIDAETAVPVTVFKMSDLRSQGVTSIEQAISFISASQSSLGTSQSVGAGTGGAAFADLRGLGPNKTLVLLNGRRVADNAIDGSAPDLNMIPIAALERIEVLRDGASSLYGTDAIGGVINFITRKDFKGGTIMLQAQKPQHDGGKSSNANIGYGFGDLETNGYNIMGMLDLQKQNKISAPQRAFGASGNIPSHGIAKSSGAPDPANYNWTDGSLDTDGNPTYAFLSNSAAPGCNSNPFIFAAADGTTCRYDYTKWVDLIPESERVSAMLKGTFKLGGGHQLGLEYFITRDKVSTTIAPVPYFGLQIDPGSTFYPGGGITPAPTGGTIDSTQPVFANWRAVPGGGRQGETKNTQQRLLATLDGALAGWDYQAGIAYNQNKIDDRLTGGYLNDDAIYAGSMNGSFNPFGAQTAATQAFINSNLVTGQLQSAKGETWTVDGHASREVGDWFGAGRQAALAVGAEFRREKFSDVANAGFAALVQSSSGFDPATNSVGSRTVAAAYAELNVPIVKSFEMTAALRDDHYSDFGNTVNPKVSLRFQPMPQVLFRSSYSTGFRAPSLFELNAPNTYTNTANPWDDPTLCPGGVPTTGANAQFCDTQFMLKAGGNKDLKPEKAKNITFGLVLEPIRGTSVAVDLFWIKLQHSINALPEELIFGDPAKYAALFQRNPAGQLSISGRDCPGTDCGYIIDTSANLGGINTHGFDLSVNSKFDLGSAGSLRFDLNGTYVAKYEYQQEEGGEWQQNAGRYSGAGPIFRWVHTANLNWTMGDWTLGLVNRFKSHYVDQNDPQQVATAYLGNTVGAYSMWDVYGSWMMMKGLTLTAGVRNVGDKIPPFSNQGATFQQGYDPRFTDATGRAYYLRATYDF